MDDPQDPFNKDINFFKSGLDQGKILGLTIRNFSLIDTKSGIASRDEWHTVVFVLPDRTLQKRALSSFDFQHC